MFKFKNKRKNNKNKSIGRDRNKSKKGQYFSFDAITAVVIFMITISLVISYWFTIQGLMDTNDSDAYRTAIKLSDTLVSKGNPEWDGLGSWVDKIPANPDDVLIAGFRVNNNVPILNEVMIQNLENYVGNVGDGTYQDVSYKNLIQALRTGYNINIKVYKEYEFAGGLGSPTYNIGLDNYIGTNKTVASYTRIITLNDSLGNLRRGNLQVNVW